jgi:hypothetical protein
MTNLKSEIHELSVEDLDTVSGGMAFFGMNCSLNQNNRIGGIVKSLNSIPFVGGVLAGIATGLGRIYCN